MHAKMRINTIIDYSKLQKNNKYRREVGHSANTKLKVLSI